MLRRWFAKQGMPQQSGQSRQDKGRHGDHSIQKPKDVSTKETQERSRIDMTRLWATQSVDADGLTVPSAAYQGSSPAEIPSLLLKGTPQTTDKGEYPSASLSEEQKETLALRKIQGDFKGISSKDTQDSDTIHIIGVDDVADMPHEFNALRRKFLAESGYYHKNEERIEKLILSFDEGRTKEFIDAFEKNTENCGIALEKAVNAFRAEKQNQYEKHLADAQRLFSLFENQMKMLRSALRS